MSGQSPPTGGETSGRGGRHTSSLVIILWFSVLVHIVVFAIRPALSYAVLEIQSTTALVGLLAASYAAPALVLALPAGRAVDRWGERRVLIGGAISLLVSSTIAMVATSSFPLLLLATAILGMGHVFTVVGGQTLVGNFSRTGQHDRMFGRYTLAASVGQAFGPLILLLPGTSTVGPPVHLVALVCVVGSAMAVGLAFFVGNSQHSAISRKRVLLREGVSSLGNSGIARAIVASSLLVASIDIFVTFAPALGIERSISVTVIVALLVVRAVTTMLARALLGGLVSTFGRREVLVGSGILSAVSLAFFAFPLPIGGLVAVAAVYGFAIGVGQPITMAWVYLLAPDHSRGLALSMRLAGNRVGQMAVPLVVGSLAAGVGTPAVFGLTSLGVLMASWVSAAVPRQDGQPTDEAPY